MTSRGHRRFVALAVLAAYALALPSRAAEPKPDDDVTARDAAIVMRWTAAWNILVWPAGSAISGCFLERDGEWRATLVKAASAWSEIANIRFDFGLAPGYRTCSLFEPSDIRVTFRPGLASSSRVGTLALDADPSLPTLVITTGALGEQVLTSKEGRLGVMLHELGHALGLPHEHQHAASPCPGEFRFELLCDHAAGKGPSASRYLMLATVFNAQRVIRLDPDPGAQPPHDADSIMHYRFPPEVLRAGRSSRCFSKTPLSFSAGDRQRAATLYPKSAADQQRVLSEQAGQLRRALAASGLSRATVRRLVTLLETRLARRHGDVAFRIDLTGLDLPATDTSALEKQLAEGNRASPEAACGRKR